MTLIRLTKKEKLVKEPVKVATPNYALDGIASKPKFFKQGKEVNPPPSFNDEGVKYF